MAENASSGPTGASIATWRDQLELVYSFSQLRDSLPETRFATSPLDTHVPSLKFNRLNHTIGPPLSINGREVS
jgi:hypothetical protein